MIIKQLSVFLENRTGRLTELTGILAASDINISAFSIADTADYGILRMIVGRPEEAAAVLRENGFAVKVTDVVGMIVPHRPGGLHHALQIISDNNVAIEYMYAFASGECNATVIIRAESIEKLIEVLQEHKLELLRQSDVYQL
ncbi:MAG: ACT domain-containing protein [Chlorobiaceae bacterium]|nr:ACT domain-containing protein [Chlorobiaceae bacterium]NTV61369.1 ACT domain-containing protein [Chlorobiaceae bacterium]